MSNKMKKIIGGIAALVIFLIGGYFYLSAPREDVADGGADYEYSDGFEDQVDSLGNVDEVDTTESSGVVESSVEATESDDDSQEYAVTYEFRKQQYLDEHFEKHGSEFDYNNADEYLAGANRVINDPNSLYKTESEDGDHIYYLESTNEFVVVSTDGYIRTYFKPSAGKSYFDRQ